MNKRDPWLGRIAAGFLLLFGTLYAVAVWLLPDRDPAANVEAGCLLALSGAGTLVGLVAIIRKSSRTPLAWLAFSVFFLWWSFYGLIPLVVVLRSNDYGPAMIKHGLFSN
jgi:hypothetical protein